MSQIKILFVDNTETFGGAILSLSYLIKGLAGTKYKPIVVSGHDEQFIKKHFGNTRYYKLNYVHHFFKDKPLLEKILALRFFKNPIPQKTAKRLHSVLFLLTHELKYFLYLLMISIRERPRIIHLNNGPGAQQSPIALAQLLRKICVSHVRGFEVNYKMGMLDRPLAKRVDRFIAISNHIKRQSIEVGYESCKVDVVENFIDPLEFEKRAQDGCGVEFDAGMDERRFCIIGRIVPWKGQKEVILAALAVFKMFENSKLYIVGDVSDGEKQYYDEIRQLISRYKIEDNVIFTGYQENIPAILKNMDLVVHASNKPEPFGRVLIEAMALRKPVIATAAGAPLDIIEHGENGFLFPIGDIDTLSGLIIDVLNDGNLAKKMGENGRKTVMERFSYKKGVERLEIIYAELLNEI
jgi:glycosyltransferase involved in cell wall biosynthesis